MTSISDQARPALRRIADMLDAREPMSRSSLFIGEAGAALYLALAARELDDAGLWERSHGHLARALERPSRLPTFAAGYFGEMWVGEMFAWLGAEVDVAVDDAFDARLASDDREFDLLNGWAGIAVYALAREARAADVVARLAHFARRDQGGATWFRSHDMLPDDSRSMFPRGHFSLGVDHGQAGVIGVLADVIASGVDAALIDEAVGWLLAHRRSAPGRAFPALIDPELGELSGSRDKPLFGDTGRESWSHGDLGIATALLAAARVRRRRDWEEIALDVADRAVSRITPGDHEWADLCDGSAGIAYLLTCLHRATGRFEAARRDWLEAAWAGITDRLTSTVMTGILGIGLVTIAAMHERAQPWETMFGVGATALYQP
jgi:class I lanthipeptide synthase